MAKVVMVFFAAVALVQLIKPLGWPGLKRRGDAWKLIVAGLFALVVTIGLRPEGDPSTAPGEPAETEPPRAPR